VMAVFIGDGKNSAAAKAALQLNWVVIEVNSALKTAYPHSAFQLKHSVGIDTSSLFVARTGIRNSNDLVWVGRAANYAAKLAGLTDPGYSAVITDDVFAMLNEQSKYGGNPKRVMWEKGYWQARNVTIYKSNWNWKP